MKVVHIIAGVSKNSGGTSAAVIGLVSALNKVGVENCLVSCNKGDVKWFEGVDDFRVFRGGNIKVFFAEVIENFKPDLIHLHGIWLPDIHIAAKVARRHKIPYVITPHGMLEPWSLEQKKWKKRIAMWLYQRKDLKKAIALHATAKSEAEHFRRLGFTNRVIISPNGVNVPTQGLSKIATASAMPRNDEHAFARHCERSEAIHTVLFMSRMHRKKGVLELVEAWAEVRPRGWKCELVYTVSGDEEREYEAKVKRHIEERGLAEDFVLTGALTGDDKWDAYRRADLFVLPTYSENFGIVIAEALYAGVPVITTKGAPWAELETHECGKWIETGVEPLIPALREMMALTDAERTAMGACGRKLVEEKYTWPAIAERMKVAYEGLMENAEGAEC